MSVNAMNWAGLCRVPGAGDRARAVLDAVAWWAADAGDPNAARAFPAVEIPEGHAACWRGVVEIAERADADPRTVRRILKRFELVGLLTRARRCRVDGQVARRTTDVLYLNLTAEPVHIERDRAQTDRRRAAALEARARRAPVPPPASEDILSSEPRGHEVPFVAAETAETPRGHLGGGLEGIVSPPLEDIVSGRTTDTKNDTRQDSGKTWSGTSPGHPSPAVDNSAAETIASSQERHRIALTAMGNRRERKLPTGPGSGIWRPLRQLSGAAFEGCAERVLAELVAAERIDPQWWTGHRDQHRDVWRQVRAEMLRQQDGSVASASAEEVA